MVELAPLPKKSLKRIKRKLLLGRSGCWIWPDRVPGNGYPQLNVANRPQVPLYRQMYFEYRGEIPDGLELHHKCMLRLCCNPRHLLPMTHSDHMKAHSHIRKFGPNSSGSWISSDRDIPVRRQDLFSLYELGNYIKKDGVVTFSYRTEQDYEIQSRTSVLTHNV